MTIGTALFLIFCTPFGWVGLFLVLLIAIVLKS